MISFIISGVLAGIVFLALDILGVIDKIEEIIFSKLLHYDPIENSEEECYNDDNEI